MTTNFQQLVARAHAQAEEYGLRYHNALSCAIFMAHIFEHEVESPSGYGGEIAKRFADGTTTTDFDNESMVWYQFAVAQSIACRGLLGNYLLREW